MKVFDVVIVGAGPCGATAAYFLANGMEGFKGKEVALLDRAIFPRDKFCGDAWCAPALDLMEEMNVLQKLEAEGLIQDCTSGGFVSPSGESYISAEDPEPGPEPSDARTYAIKRKICDEAIVRGAERVGAQLFENADCESAELEADGLWTVKCRDGRQFRSKMLIAADGAASNLCRSLGIVTTPPDGTASRQYIKGGTHNFKSGGVLFYPDYAIPGYVAIFRHYDDDIDVGVYLIEGGATPPENILDVAIDKVSKDPFMQRLLGSDAIALERPRVASLRTGGEERSSAAQFMAVGDAAGQTDPLTGEGIHTGMIGAKLAALTIHEMYEKDNFSESECQVYHERWWKDFGKDFPASAIGAKMTYKMPLLLDAAAVVAQNKGDDFIEDFGAAMTGVKPKTTFLKPRVSVPITLEIFRQIFIQKILRPFKSVREAYEARAVELENRLASFNISGLINSEVEAKPFDLMAGASDDFDKLFRYRISVPDTKRVYLFYGSEYGFSEELAEEVAEHLLELGKQNENQTLDIRLLSLEHFSLIDWKEVTTCLFFCSTAGDGDPPQSIEAFLKNAQASLELAHIDYSVLALGDSAYPNFCAAGIELDAILQKCGAKRFKLLGKVNAESRSDINAWLSEVSAKLASKPYWETVPIQIEEQLENRAESYFENLSPPEPGGSARTPVLVEIASRVQIGNPELGGTETFSISLNTKFDKGVLDWEPGDALGIFPENPQEEVNAVLALIKFDPNCQVELPRKKGQCSFLEAINKHADLKNLSESFWAFIEAESSEEDKKRIRNIEEQSNWELQDLLKAFPESFENISGQALIDNLAVLQPRYYSIASSKARNADKMELSVASLDFKILDGLRHGVASHFLNHQLVVGNKVNAFVQKNKHFRIPEQGSKKSCVMIGAGTGVAPYRGFLQDITKENMSDRKHLLFFGCRHEKADYLYRDEWEEWQTNDCLQVFTAFSRDQSEKIYVQDRLKEQGKLVWDAINAGDHFYICGDATKMAVDVEKALLEIICEHGKKKMDQAKAMLQKMSDENRYQKDVWV
jgi:sulfite reductase alpha subunit-like flavoprotein/flavin-dependent dehydrogenase